MAWLWSFFLAVLILVPERSHALEITERAYWEDSQGTATWSQAQEQTYTVSEGLISRGYKTHPTWIRLRLEPSERTPVATHQAEPWVLRVRPSFLDSIELYDPAVSDAGTAAVAGDRHPVSHTQYPSINHRFVLPAPGQARYIWIKLHTSSSHVFLADVYPLSEAVRLDRKQDAFNVVLITLQTAFLLWAVIGWWSTRDSLLLWFIHKQFWILPYLLLINGYARILLDDTVPPPLIDQITNFFVLIYTMVAYLFDRQVLKTNGGPRWSVYITNGIFMIWPFALVLLLLDQPSIAMQFNMLLVTIAPIIILTGVIFSPSRVANFYQFNKWILVGYYSLVSTPLLMTALPFVGISHGFRFSLDSVYVHTVLSGLLLVVMLQIRTRSIDLARIQTLGDLALVEEQAMQHKKRREDMGRFFSMLTHELRTPLAVIKMVLPSPRPSTDTLGPEYYIHRAVQDIDNLIDRCIDVEKIDSENLKIRPQLCDLLDEIHICVANCETDRLRLSSSLETAKLYSDPKHLQNILNNLLSNALRYSPENSVVDIIVDSWTRGYCVSISNTSSDAEPIDTSRVFEKYYRAASAHRVTGAGLGLYVAKHLATALGGELEIKQSEVHRVTFNFYVTTA